MIVLDGVTYEQLLLAISGRSPLEDELTEHVVNGRTVEVVLRGRFVRIACEPGGPNTEQRAIATLRVDVIDRVSEADALDGQLRIGANGAT
jgi:hypothetical protein